MRTTAIALLASAVMVGCGRTEPTAPSTGPNGGDVVPIKNGTGYAELLANADTGEVMVHTWDKDLKTPKPIEKEPITVGSGDNSAELIPHPTATDPAGRSSRFYGHAGWARRKRRAWVDGAAGRREPAPVVRLAGVLAEREGTRADVGGYGRTPEHGAGRPDGTRTPRRWKGSVTVRVSRSHAESG